MLLLLITSADSSGEVRDFAYGTDRLELGFEFISKLVRQGTTLIKVKLFDEGHYISLPLEVFDGSSIAEPIQELEKEWRCLLTE
ncbi:MAG: hypothetical protein EOP45_07380 [Sphingobacteriaceae bacterium]|nr:MAG: hypothetical protein EOP45_07380 [Sphingobacteriaceae bacterium]